MKTVKRVIITLFVMAGIAALAFGINKFIDYRQAVKFEKERIVRTEEVGAVTEEKKEEIVQISQLSKDEIRVYIEENAYIEEDEEEPSEVEEPIEDPWANTEFFDYYISDYAEEDLAESIEDAIEEETSERSLIVHDSGVPLGIPVSENLAPDATDATEAPEATQSPESGDTPEATGSPESETTPEATGSPESETTPEATISPTPETTPDASVSPTPETTPDANTQTTPDGSSKENVEGEEESWSALSKEENVKRVAELGKEAVEGNLGAVTEESEEEQTDSRRITLKDRQKFRSSEEETQLWIEADNKILAESENGFEGLKIACLGDSITEATNLDDLEDYEQYSYPARLKEVLGASEVVNLGIGGSSYGRYWDHAFCERYTEIPEDTDLIIVMGGDNDGYCLTEDLVGSLDDRSQRTLYGDVDELMRGLKDNYPNARVVFMTPMPNLLHDVLRKEREDLLPQTVVVNCILELAEEYDFEVIDLYNSNFFDSHDAEIVSDYIPDSVHPNEEGYDIFARHVAAELIRLDEKSENEESVEQDEPGENTTSAEEVSEEGAMNETESDSGKTEAEEDNDDTASDDGDDASDAEDEEKYDGTTDDHSYTNKIKDRIDSRLTPEEIKEYEERTANEESSDTDESQTDDEQNSTDADDSGDEPVIKTYARDE